MRKKHLLILVVTSIATLFIAAGIYAASAPDVIPMNNPIIKKRTKGIVQFTHKKHVVDYKAGCGECHHDDKGQPLNNLKDGDPVDSCAKCHKETGKMEKGLKKKEKVKRYYKEAIHANCKDCHKKWNKKNKSKAAPTKCADCHPKKKK
jgi:hypothetical protein